MVTKDFWLVGFTFRSPRGRLVQHFYVVPTAPHAEAAREAALSRARTSSECLLREGLDVESAAVEARKVLCDDIGVWHLADREPSLGEPATVLAAA
ncbi:hypothetical protein [Streptomyces sp. E5N91]|uniref:hypothetical protein n=1 Tax=Streptomyces sp. E5N91 TaxID=1851996 RepID=UPI000EF5D9D0|nr:hypothetical protein [Streptomyces sp. E5N91]